MSYWETLANITSHPAEKRYAAMFSNQASRGNRPAFEPPLVRLDEKKDELPRIVEPPVRTQGESTLAEPGRTKKGKAPPVGEFSLPRGRPKKAPGSKPTVSHYVASALDDHQNLDALNQQVLLLQRARRLMKQGYFSSKQLDVRLPDEQPPAALMPIPANRSKEALTRSGRGLIAPNQNRETAHNLDARLSPAEAAYDLQGNYVGLVSNPYIDSRLKAAAAQPARFRIGDGRLPVTAGNGIDRSTGYGAASSKQGTISQIVGSKTDADGIREGGPIRGQAEEAAEEADYTEEDEPVDQGAWKPVDRTIPKLPYPTEEDEDEEDEEDEVAGEPIPEEEAPMVVTKDPRLPKKLKPEAHKGPTGGISNLVENSKIHIPKPGSGGRRPGERRATYERRIAGERRFPTVSNDYVHRAPVEHPQRSGGMASEYGRKMFSS